MAKLNEQIEKLRDDHAHEMIDNLTSAHQEKSRNDALFFLGRIKQNDHIAQAVASNLSAQSIRALEHFQQERMYESFGYSTFVDFLEKSEWSPMTKRQYYDRLNTLRELGDEVFDLLTSAGISVRAQKLIGKGDITISEGKLLIGDQEVSIDNSGVIKQVLVEFVDEMRAKDTKIKTLEQTVTERDTTIEKGRDEINDLRRALDHEAESSPYERALMNAIKAMITLTGEIKELDADERGERAEPDLKTLAEQWFQARDAYGVRISMHERQPDTDDDLDAAINEALANSDGLDELDYVDDE
ncbi:MAG: hypothetical protein IPM50_02775 [Acidobacteriota bacterium]|nr:MAG: hypothetical protein IPM50_02775 [Acidobacteriota bacterium]